MSAVVHRTTCAAGVPSIPARSLPSLELSLNQLVDPLAATRFPLSAKTIESSLSILVFFSISISRGFFLRFSERRSRSTVLQDSVCSR